ncbi:Hydrolase family protein / HAD-superfamily protein isoform 1 [Theobroma cacao]|uniref:Hydrolase family protein / HAD-superfamily protein isoform 1 n=1 Tax=Theobroma cacao TaxID=3641 RepID=A0A061FUJ7_THECC|nr:Hydrolase family protein / HAD-superfamily protein isoform 1 [Theobroma cacao]
MRFHATTISRVSQLKNRAPVLFQSSQLRSNHQKRCNFGIAFDIDGVILRGRVPTGGSPQALRRLYGDSGGGVPETKRAKELSELLGVNILPSQVVQGHSPFRNLLKKFENELIIATGKGNPALVMSEYGFKKVLSLEEYASYFESIDPVSQYKRWTTAPVSDRKTPAVPRYDVFSERIKAAFVVSDPVDWGRDIQVLCDILRSGGLPGDANRNQPPLYFAADDLEYQAAFPSERLGLGAFRIALESIFNIINPKGLEYVSYGKPNPFVFKNAEAILSQLQSSSCIDHSENNGVSGSHPFETLYMIGDNPSVDVKGARQSGHPWFSILTRTGVFRGKDNHAEFPANLVVDTVEEAVDYILRREYNS